MQYLITQFEVFFFDLFQYINAVKYHLKSSVLLLH